jgi:ribosomal-protein-serine acetyltransferase
MPARSAKAPPPPPKPWRVPSPLPARLETSRLVIRWWEPADAAGLFAAIESSRASLLPWLPWARVDNRTEAEVIYTIERFRRERERTDGPASEFVMGILDRRTGGVLGGLGLQRIRHDVHEGEIGYWVRADRQGEGLCTEAVSGLVTWAFRGQGDGGWGLRRIHIRCSSKNAASARVPEKLGIKREGELRGDRWTDGIGWDGTLIFGVLAGEWDARAGRVKG